MVLGPGYHCPLPYRSNDLFVVKDRLGTRVCFSLGVAYLCPPHILSRAGVEAWVGEGVGESGVAEGAGGAGRGTATYLRQKEVGLRASAAGTASFWGPCLGCGPRPRVQCPLCSGSPSSAVGISQSPWPQALHGQPAWIAA